MKRIDLNCDMGESFGAWPMGADAEVMPWVTSVNVACGAHAGDPMTMRSTISAAVEAGVHVGAHVGLPDRLGFGRRAMAISADEAYAMTVTQIGAVVAMLRTFERTATHMKPHGALYHMAEEDAELAEALVAAVRDVDSGLRVVGRAGGCLVAKAREAGLQADDEVFADRRYLDNGHLAPRGTDGAVIEDVDQAVEQAIGLAVDGKVTTADGGQLTLRADTLCVHGDRPGAGDFARALNEGLRDAGVELHGCGDDD